MVVSPHFDDAALGAAHLLTSYPGSTVITVLAGRPPAYPDQVTDWDAAGGFASGDDVVGVRQEEDRAAMASMGATPVWLDFPDHQYLTADQRPTAGRGGPRPAAGPSVAAAPDVGVPAHGPGQSRPCADPRRRAGCPGSHGGGAGAMWCGSATRTPATSIFPACWPGGCPSCSGAACGPHLRWCRSSRTWTAKRTAIALYTSQVGPLERDHLLSERLDANIPEQYWRLDASACRLGAPNLVG